MADAVAGETGRVGSVAEETARLLDALFGAATDATDATNATDATSDSAAAAAAPTEAAPGDRPALPCLTCGHPPAGTHTPGSANVEVCHLCPVCQLLRVARAVRPETLDRLADLAAAVTETLRDAAATRWRDAGASPPPPRRPTVEEITVEDEDPAADDEPAEHEEVR